MRRRSFVLAALIGLALALPAHSRPQSDHLEAAKDRLVQILDGFLELSPAEFNSVKKIARSYRRATESYTAESDGLKGDLKILGGMSKNIGKAVKLIEKRGVTGLDDVAPLLVDALELFDNDVQTTIDEVDFDIGGLPPSNLQKKAEALRKKAQTKIAKSRKAPTLVARTKLLTQACRQSAKAAVVYAKARAKSPLHPCLGAGTPFGTMEIQQDDFNAETDDPFVPMESIDASVFEDALTVIGTHAQNPFLAGVAFESFRMTLLLHDATSGPYPKQYAVDGPAAGRQGISIASRQDGNFIGSKNFGAGTVTITSFDRNSRVVTGSFDIVVDDALPVPRTMRGTFTLDCFTDHDAFE